MSDGVYAGASNGDVGRFNVIHRRIPAYIISGGDTRWKSVVVDTHHRAVLHLCQGQGYRSQSEPDEHSVVGHHRARNNGDYASYNRMLNQHI